MAWTPKAGSPPYLRMLESVLAAISGSPDAWLIPWFALAPGEVVLDTAAFCAAGPPDAVEFTLTDFLGIVPGVRVNLAGENVQLGEKIGAWMYSRLFAAHCESDESTPGECDIVDMMWAGAGVEDYAKIGPGVTDWVHLPAGATWVSPRYGSPTAISNATIHFANEAKTAFTQVGWVGAGSGYQVNIPASRTWLALTANFGTTSRQLKVTVDCDIPIEHDQPELVQPDSAIPPEAGVYTTISDLGAELDKLEQKLHWVLSYTSGQIVEQIAPLVADEVLPVVSAEEDVELAEDVAAFIITCSDIPPSVDASFPPPQKLHRLGWVFIGNGTAWEPPVEISTTPMLLMKTSTFQTVCRVQLIPGATATVTTLVKAPPLG